MKEIDLTLLQELLSTGITPAELAYQLDEMAYFYAQMTIWLQNKEPEGTYMHENADMFIFRLKQLRDVLLNCNEKDNE